MTMWRWLKSAAGNATADPTVNWLEGQAPSTINDSARAMMAALAAYRDDISGAITTTGTGTAYVVVTNSGLPTPPTPGTMISFVAHATNGAGASLTVDGSGPFQIWDSSGDFPPPGALIAGVPYEVMWTGAVWRLKNSFGNPYSIPIGGYLHYAGAGSPNSSFVQPSGQMASRTVYSKLFSMIGTVYGIGDGSTTFNLPDFRGRVAVTSDNMVGATAAAGRSPGFEQVGSAGGAQFKTLTLAELPAANLTLTGTPATISVNSNQNDLLRGTAIGSSTGGGGFSFIAVNVAGGGTNGIVSSGSYTPQGTVYNGGANVPFSLMQPSFTVNMLLRII